MKLKKEEINDILLDDLPNSFVESFIVTPVITPTEIDLVKPRIIFLNSYLTDDEDEFSGEFKAEDFKVS